MPSSKFKLILDFINYIFLIFNVIFIPFNLSFRIYDEVSNEKTYFYFLAMYLPLCVFIVHSILTINTAYYFKGLLVNDKIKMAK